MQKILFLGAGSKDDPGFEDVKIGKTLYKKYMKSKGIKVIDPIVIQSCHGCPDLMQDYSRQMQYLVKNDDKVVGVLQGGKTFVLPSIQATQVTYPIISCPLDMVAYQAFVLPSGHSCIAGVGIDREIDGKYQTSQREKALVIAERILNLKESTVAVEGDGNLEKLTKELFIFGIKISHKSKLLLSYSSIPEANLEEGYIQVWADINEDPYRGEYFDEAEQTLRMRDNTVQVSGIKNLALFATKIFSLQRPDLIKKLKKIRLEKISTYDQRNLITEIRKMGE